ncbi:hypothetical protein VTI74DRAFT_4670 [Chaetomium olivicolor]
MARNQLSLTTILLLALLSLVSGNTSSNKEAKVGSPSGSSHGLVYDPIENAQLYTSNTTTPPVQGWWDSKICSGPFCVYTNLRLARGRGLVAVTKPDEFNKLSRIEDHLDRGENRCLQSPLPFTLTPILNRGLGLTANTTLRRGKPLLVFSPKSERTRLLGAAVSFLPAATRAIFNTQRAGPGDGDAKAGSSHLRRSIEDILLAHPFELDLSYAATRQDETTHSRHYVNYPEMAQFQHDCRPNVATHLDNAFALRATVARKVLPGEELSVSYVDPFLPREGRRAWVERYRGNYAASSSGGGGVGCPCRACSPPGGEKGEEAKKGEQRLKEILEIRKEVRNHVSKKVTFQMIERFLKLFKKERLHARFAEAYELAALNFNYLGDDERAKKYADLAVQAGIVEGGSESNDVVAMRVFAKDVGHDQKTTSGSMQHGMRCKSKTPVFPLWYPNPAP